MLAFAKRQLVNIALHKVECAIEIGPGVISRSVDEEGQRAVVAFLKAHRLLPGKGSSDAQAAEENAGQISLARHYS